MGPYATAELIQDSATEQELSVELVSDPDVFIGIANTWKELLERAGIDCPFLTHQWVQTWWESFGRGKKLHILLVKSGEEPIGIAPLMLTRRRFYGLPVNCLEFIANVHTPRCDFIVSRRAEDVYRAIWTALRDQNKLWDMLLLCQVPFDSSTLQEIGRLAGQDGMANGQWISADSPYLLIREGWDDYFKGISSKHRSNVSRRLRRLSETGDVKIERVSSEYELEGALEEGFRIEGAAWKDHVGTSIHFHPDSRRFYTKLAERFGRMGWLQLCFLTVAGRRIAFHYSVCYGNKVYLLKPGYDPQFASFSPVNLLCFLFLKEAFRNGLSEFDFLGVEDEWKLQWSRTVRRHYWLFVFSKRPAPWLIYLTKFRILPRLRTTRIYQSLRNRFGHTEQNGNRHNRT